MLLLYLEGYYRGRAWAAWNAGAPANFEDVTFDDLLGKPRKPKAMDPEQMKTNLHRFAVGHNAALAARAREGVANGN